MPAPTHRLPPVARWIIRATFPVAERIEVASDLSAEFDERRTGGRLRAHVWLWTQLARSTPVLLRRGVWRGWIGYESRANMTRPGGAPFEGMVMDGRFAVRRLRSRPLYATLAILTLALGVGGSSAI